MRPLALAAILSWPCGAPDLPPYPVVEVPPGSFTRGSQAPGADIEAPPTQVTLTRGFEAGRFELTQAHVRALLGRHPSRDEQTVAEGQPPRPCADGGVGDDLPATCISWVDAVDLANALSERHGLSPAYDVEGAQAVWDRSADGWRLPTEAEWQWMAFAGQESDWDSDVNAGTPCARANVRDQLALAAHPEGGRFAFPCRDGHAGLAAPGAHPPGPHGLHDTSGNVWEWVWDAWGPWPSQPLTNPTGPAWTHERVARGGSWNSTREHTMAEARIHGRVETRGRRLGVRLVRGAHPEPAEAWPVPTDPKLPMGAPIRSPRALIAPEDPARRP